jgi:hypothetical protein
VGRLPPPTRCDLAGARALAAALALAGALAGCGKTVTEEDCRVIASNLRDAWRDETKDVSREGPTADKAAGVIKSEGEKLAGDWALECRTKLLGQEVDSDELACLLRGKSLADLRTCKKAR